MPNHSEITLKAINSYRARKAHMQFKTTTVWLTVPQVTPLVPRYWQLHHDTCQDQHWPKVTHLVLTAPSRHLPGSFLKWDSLNLRDVKWENHTFKLINNSNVSHHQSPAIVALGMVSEGQLSLDWEVQNGFREDSSASTPLRSSDIRLSPGTHNLHLSHVQFYRRALL